MDLCPALQGLASKLALYKKDPSKENQTECEHQLDLILTISSNVRQLSAKCKYVILEHDVILSGLIQLIEGRLRTPHMLHKTMMVLNHLMLDRDVLKHCVSWGLVSQLARFLQRATDPIYQSNVLQAVKLLQLLSYRLSVTCPNGYIEHILDFSVQTLLAGDSERRTGALEIISNLAYSNLSVQAYLKGLSTASALNRLLISNLKEESLVLIILSLCVLSSLWLHEDLGVRIFNEKNVEQTFQLIFKLACQSSEHLADAELVVRGAVDLFCSITQAVRVQNALDNYEKLFKCLQTVSSLFSVSDGIRISHLLQLLMTICRFDKPAHLLVNIFLFDSSSDASKRPPPTLAPPLADLLNWVGQPLLQNHCTTFLAIDFLTELFEMDAGPPHLVSQVAPAVVKHLNIGMNCVRTERQQSEPLAGNLYVTKLVKLLQLLRTLSRHSSHLSSVASSLSDQLLLDLYSFCISSNSSLFLLQQGDMDTAEKTLTIQLLLATVSLLASLQHTHPSYHTALTFVLEDARLLPYLSHALTHSSRHETILSLQLLRQALQLPNFHLSNFGNILASDFLNRREQMEQLRTELQPSQTRPEVETPPLMKLDSEAVDSSIERMRSGLSLSEMRNSDIVDIYEYKLSTLDTKVSQLESLLEAKSLSLQQSERLVAQLRCKRAESESECQSLSKDLAEMQTDLQREEERGKRLSEREKQLMLETEALHRDFSALRGIEDKYSQTRVELVERREQCVQLEKDLKTESLLVQNLHKTQEVLEANIQALKSQQERLFEQLKELEREKQKCKQRLAEKEKLLKEMEVSVAQEGTRRSRMERQMAETRAERDSLATQVSDCQKNKEKLQERVNELHAENLHLSGELCVVREEQKQTRVQLEKMQQLAAMIHNLSGNPSKPESAANK